MKKIGATLDGEIKPEIEVLFDGYKAKTEKLEELNDKVDDLRLDVNSLSIKTTRTDSKIIWIDRKIHAI